MTNNTPQQVYALMMQRDRFSEWLGLQLEEMGEGYCRLHFTIREEMLNGFDIVHGGIYFAAADSAFAFAANSHGVISVALDVSITFTQPAKLGDTLLVVAKEIYKGNKTSLYEVRVTNANTNELLAMYKGTAYRTGKMHALQND